MSDNRRHIDDLFRSGLADHEAAPPHSIWKGINSHLARRRRSLYARRILRAAAMILILLGLGGGLMQIFRQDTITKNYLSPDPLVKSPDYEMVTAPDRPPLSDSESEAFEEAVRAVSPRRLHEPGYTGRSAFARLVSPGMKKEKAPEMIPPAELQALRLPDQKKRVLKIQQPEPHSVTLSHEIQGRITEKGRWTAGIMFTPSYSYRSISKGEEGSLSRIHYNLIESGLVNLSGSFSVSYSFSRRISLQSGLDLLRMGQSIGDLQIFDNPAVVELLRSDRKEGIPGDIQPVSNSMGVIRSSGETVIVTDNYDRLFNDFAASSATPVRVPKNHKSGSIIQDLSYFHIPVVLRYRIIDRETSLVASGGIGLSYMSGNRVILKYQDEVLDIGHTSSLKDFGMTGIMGLGIEHKIRNNFMFTFEPRLIHFLNPLNPGSEHLHRPYSLSVYGGISYGF